VSLAQAILDIVADMEEYVKVLADKNADLPPIEVVAGQVYDFTRMLHIAVKAAQGSEPTGIFKNPMMAQAVLGINRNGEQQLASAKEFAEIQERGGMRMVELRDQPDEDSAIATLVPIDPKMPVGAYTSIAGQDYQLGADGHLHWVMFNEKTA
jgi:hypothetical protein